MAEAVVPLGGFEFTLEAGDLGGAVVDNVPLGLSEGVVEIRAGEAGAVQLIEERVARVCLPAFQRVGGFGGDEACEEAVGGGGWWGWLVGGEVPVGGEVVEGGKQ